MKAIYFVMGIEVWDEVGLMTVFQASTIVVDDWGEERILPISMIMNGKLIDPIGAAIEFKMSEGLWYSYMK